MKNLLVNIVAYNRPNSLKRLLDSLAICDFGDEIGLKIDLRISIDYSGSNECLKIANSFYWRHGATFVLQREENLGLLKHIIEVGNNSLDYDFFVVLEDDLIVSPSFLIYLNKLLSDEILIIESENLAQISLYNPRVNEYTGLYWEPIQDGYQNYYLQIPSSCGQLYSREQWIDFVNFYQNFDFTYTEELPANVKLWPSNSSWKKIFFQYILNNKKFVFYPRFSLTSNLGDKGTHFDKEVFDFRTSLLLFLESSVKLNFSIFDKSRAIYNSNLDLLSGNFVSKILVTNENLLLKRIEDQIHFPFESFNVLMSGKDNVYFVFNSDTYIHLYSKFFDPRNKLRDYYISDFVDKSKILKYYFKIKKMIKFKYSKFKAYAQ